MKQTLILFIILAITHQQDFPTENGVVVLEDENFQQALSTYIENKQSVLVQFHASWDKTSKKFMPTYSKIFKDIQQDDIQVIFVKIDASQNIEVAELFDIQTFPVFIHFQKNQQNGKFKNTTYSGQLNEKDISDWVRKLVGQSSVNLKTLDQYQSFLEQNEISILFLSLEESNPAIQAFQKIALENTNKKLNFAHSSSKEILTKSGGQQSDKLIIIKPFDEKRNDFFGPFNKSSILQFIKENSVPSIVNFDDSTLDLVFKQGIPSFILFVSNQDHNSLKQFNLAAKEVRGKDILFTFVNNFEHKEQIDKLAEFVGVNLSKLPQIVLVKQEEKGLKKYRFEQKIEKTLLLTFFDDFKQNKLQSFLKSEEIPAKNNQNVKVIVGKSFQDEVMNNDRDILLKFYAPWCTHCQNLAPAWEEAATLLKEKGYSKKITIAKLDSTANEVPGFNIDSYPTLKFFPAGDKEHPIDFNGERTAQGILKWLKKHTTQKLKKDDL